MGIFDKFKKSKQGVKKQEEIKLTVSQDKEDNTKLDADNQVKDSKINLTRDDCMGDIERICSNRDITKRLSKVVNDETLWQRVYIFCKHLAKFSHAPITLNDYKRMEKYTNDKELVEAVYNAIKDYFYIDNSDGHFDIIGHAYCIALLSQTKYNRENTINYLNKCADILIKNNEQGYGLAMYRNMKTLSKEYPDLKNLEKKLQCFKDYDYLKEKNNK